MSSAWDILYRRIPNWLILTAGVLGGLSHADIIFSPLSTTWLDSIIGIFLVLMVLLPFWLARVMGAGDIKFFMVLSLWLGWKILIPIWMLSVFISLIHLVIRKFLIFWGKVDVDGAKKRFMPYVAYISMATVTVLILNK